MRPLEVRTGRYSSLNVFIVPGMRKYVIGAPSANTIPCTSTLPASSRSSLVWLAKFSSVDDSVPVRALVCPLRLTSRNWVHLSSTIHHPEEPFPVVLMSSFCKTVHLLRLRSPVMLFAAPFISSSFIRLAP